jgi:hypothetical protein
MPTGYYLGFDVVKINANGVMQRQANQVVQVFDLTNNVSLGTVQANSAGVVGAGSFNVAAGTLIKFSVTGYTPFITRTLTNQPEFAGIADVALVIENLYTPTPVTPAYNDIYLRNGSNSEAVKIGRIAPGETLQIPHNPAMDANLEIYAIARSEQGAADVFDLAKAVRVDITPNRETLTPDFSQSGAAQNALINFLASNFTVAKYRKIQYADDAAFTTNVVTIIEGNNNQIISANFSITRTGDLTNTKTVYVRIAHSTNNIVFGAWSPAKQATFANSGGSGGSGGGLPPTNLHGYYHGGLDQMRIFWTNNGGTTNNELFHQGSSFATVSNTTSQYLGAPVDVGLNTYRVENADGSATWEYYWDGGEL